MRDEARRYWQRVHEQREAEERDRQAWIADLKHRLGIRCIGDEEEPPRVEWPVLPDGYEAVPYKYFGMSTMMASRDLVHWYAKPEEMTTAELFNSLP